VIWEPRLPGWVGWIFFQDFSAITYFAIQAPSTAVAELVLYDWIPPNFNATSITPERIMITSHLTPPYMELALGFKLNLIYIELYLSRIWFS
jgi:hypothetical protein